MGQRGSHKRNEKIFWATWKLKRKQTLWDAVKAVFTGIECIY